MWLRMLLFPKLELDRCDKLSTHHFFLEVNSMLCGSDLAMNDIHNRVDALQGQIKDIGKAQ
jgi:hypothetical protein